jgi:nickel-dependent lactate racemase
MEVSLKYGQGHLALSIPDKARVSVLNSSRLPALGNLEAAFDRAMDAPLGGVRLEDLAPPRKVAIAVPDETRPAPVKALLPLLLRRLYGAFAGLRPGDITIIVAAGLHPPLDDDGLKRVVPQAVAPGCRVISHDALHSPMRDYGETSRHTPVLINADFAAADLRILIGSIDPHQFVGFTGGAKVAVIGCGSSRTIEANHALMSHDRAKVANIEGNPVRMDIDEAGRMIGVPLVINVVLDDTKRPVQLLAGEPVAVCRAGAETCASIYGVAIPETFDMAVASCGGHPKDISLYQAQKGLAHAAQAVKPGGKILLLAACPQGVGDDVYLEYVSRFPSPDAALMDFKKTGFRMGAHKAFLFSRTLVACEVAIASDMDPAILRRCHLRACDPQETLERWVGDGAGSPSLAVIPDANTTYFYRK